MICLQKQREGNSFKGERTPSSFWVFFPVVILIPYFSWQGKTAYLVEVGSYLVGKTVYLVGS